MAIKKFYILLTLCILALCLVPTFAATKSIYGDYAPEEPLTSQEQQWIVGTLTALLFILMAFEITAPEVLFLIALMIVVLCEIISLSDGLSGFSNNATVTIGTLYLVIAAVEKSHVVDWIARKTFGATGSVRMGQVRMFTFCFAMSTFFNNTPLVAILMPVVKDWGRMRGISASQLLMPLSYAVLAGSFGSMIGTSTNLTVQGLMEADRNYAFSFFAPMAFGAPMFVVLLIYMTFAAQYLLPHKNGLIREIRDKTKNLIAEVQVSPESLFVGKSVGNIMVALGIAPSGCIKIRRKTVNGVLEPVVPAKEITLNTIINDPSYVVENVRFWFNRTPPPSNEGGAYNSAPSNDVESGTATCAGTGTESNDKNSDSGAADASVEYVDIIAPSFDSLVGADDILFISSAQDVVAKLMKSILGESKGLHILKSDVLNLPGFGSEIVEFVVSDTNPFRGSKVSSISNQFAERYKAAIITVRGVNWDEENETAPAVGSVDASSVGLLNQEGSSPAPGDIELTSAVSTSASDNSANALDRLGTESIPVVKSMSEHVVTTGDVILAVTSHKEIESLVANKDFYVVSTVGALPAPLTFYKLIPLMCFIVMLVVVGLEYIDICPCALALTAFFFIGGWIKPQDIAKEVDLRLLMLLGCSISFSISMTKSGLAETIAAQISESEPTPLEALFLIYSVTLAITELISNNAAAALMYPIAVGLADQLSVSFKPFAMIVLIASTAGFMSPIGYQTHVMVWGPGGYRFKDFIIFGFIPDIIYLVISCLMVPAVFPF